MKKGNSLGVPAVAQHVEDPSLSLKKTVSSLAWELPYAMGVAKTEKKIKEKKKLLALPTVSHLWKHTYHPKTTK